MAAGRTAASRNRHLIAEGRDIPGAVLPVITLDGPSGAGKSTLGAALAKVLGWTFFDSGLAYRGVAGTAIVQGVAISDIRTLSLLAAELKLKLDGGTLKIGDLEPPSAPRPGNCGVRVGYGHPTRGTGRVDESDAEADRGAPLRGSWTRRWHGDLPRGSSPGFPQRITRRTGEAPSSPECLWLSRNDKRPPASRSTRSGARSRPASARTRRRHPRHVLPDSR
jgi:hypothetical protein